MKTVAYALCALAALRTLLVVLPVPMYGYANNYDFIRISAVFDLWPLAPDGRTDFEPRAQHPAAPLRCYHVDHAITSDIRYPSLELAVVWLALRVNDAWRALRGPSLCELDLRVLGILRAALLLASGVVVTRAFLERSARAGVGAALVLAVVLADPAVTLLFNTLYGDFSGLLLAYLASAQVVYAVAFGRFGRGAMLGLAATLLALAMTKTQFAGLAVVLVTILAAAAARLPARERPGRAWPAVALAGVAAVAGLIVQERAMHGGGYMWSMRMDAATNVYFGALAYHSDPARGLAVLGLPARCRPYVGRTWYDERMQPPPCPEIDGVARTRLLPLLLDDPALAPRVAAAALPRLRSLVVRDYGQVEGAHHGQADDRWRAGLGSVSRVVEAMPLPVLATLLAISVLAGVVAAFDLLIRGPRRTSSARLLPAVTAVACAIELYSIASSLIGGGLPDLGRHALLGQLAFVVLLAASPLLIAREVGAVLRRRPPADAAIAAR